MDFTHKKLVFLCHLEFLSCAGRRLAAVLLLVLGGQPLVLTLENGDAVSQHGGFLLDDLQFLQKIVILGPSAFQFRRAAGFGSGFELSVKAFHFSLLLDELDAGAVELALQVVDLVLVERVLLVRTSAETRRSRLLLSLLRQSVKHNMSQHFVIVFFLTNVCCLFKQLKTKNKLGNY